MQDPFVIVCVLFLPRLRQSYVVYLKSQLRGLPGGIAQKEEGLPWGDNQLRVKMSETKVCIFGVYVHCTVGENSIATIKMRNNFCYLL